MYCGTGSSETGGFQTTASTWTSSSSSTALGAGVGAVAFSTKKPTSGLKEIFGRFTKSKELFLKKNRCLKRINKPIMFQFINLKNQLL
jgi:hypothetical protein